MYIAQQLNVHSWSYLDIFNKIWSVYDAFDRSCGCRVDHTIMLLVRLPNHITV